MNGFLVLEARRLNVLERIETHKHNPLRSIEEEICHLQHDRGAVNRC